MPGKTKSPAGKASARAVKAKPAPAKAAPVVAEAVAAEIVPEVITPEVIPPEAIPEVVPTAPVVEEPAAVVAEAPEVEITPTTTPPAIKKERTMTTTIDFSAFQNTLSDVQAKAKEAYEKSTAVFGDYNTFAKGNVEALVEAGKILSTGLQELSTGLVAESRTAFEALTAEAKELAAAKTPTEFLRLQSDCPADQPRHPRG